GFRDGSQQYDARRSPIPGEESCMMQIAHCLTRFCLATLALVVVGLAPVLTNAVCAIAQDDIRVSIGSPTTPFSQNKQNEPALAVDAAHPNILAAGANDEIDMEACNAGADNTCPFTQGVGDSGVYISFYSGHITYVPTTTGWSSRMCLT